MRLDALIAGFAREMTNEPVPEWILPPRSCEFLRRLAELFPAGSFAFEFGSGRSTHLLRRAFGGVTTVEDSADWLRQTEHLPAAVQPRASDCARVLPLRRCWNRLRPIQSFDVEADPQLLRRLSEASLVLVDSPPNPAKREHALYTALRYAPAGAIIVADDLEVGATRRFTERLARQNVSALSYRLLDIDHQLGIVLKKNATQKIRSRPTLREFIGTWLRA